MPKLLAALGRALGLGQGRPDADAGPDPLAGIRSGGILSDRVLAACRRDETLFEKAVIESITRGNFTTLKQLASTGLMAGVLERRGRTFMNYAALYQNNRAIGLFGQQGVSIDLPDGSGCRPIFTALRSEADRHRRGETSTTDELTSDLLFRLGAQQARCDQEEQSPAEYATCLHHPKYPAPAPTDEGAGGPAKGDLALPLSASVIDTLKMTHRCRHSPSFATLWQHARRQGIEPSLVYVLTLDQGSSPGSTAGLLMVNRNVGYEFDFEADKVIRWLEVNVVDEPNVIELTAAIPTPAARAAAFKSVGLNCLHTEFS